MVWKSRTRSYHVHLRPDRLHQILKLLVNGDGNQDTHGSTVQSVNGGGRGCRPAIAPLQTEFGTIRATVAGHKPSKGFLRIRTSSNGEYDGAVRGSK